MIDLSIIVPIYNVEPYLLKCLKSIQAQEFSHFECLLVDDCSTDGCAKICQQFCKEDTRFKYIKREKNGGLGAARNTGLDNAKGGFISFIDSDDTIEPNFYTVLLPYARRYGWVKSGLKSVRENGDIIKFSPVADGLFTIKDADFKLLSDDRRYDVSTVCSCIFRRSIIGGLRFDTCKYGEDYVFSLELLARYGKIYFKNIHLYNYLARQNSLSSVKTVNKFQLITFLNSFCKMLRNISNLPSYNKLKPIYVHNFENRAYLKELCSNGIDFVFPFVDSTDPNWQKAYLAAKGISKDNQESNGISRFRPNNYLKYLFRSVAEYMPWINKIHLIVSDESQIPKWIDKDKIHIVLHKDIIPAELLPTFNSSTIEMFYHNIVGLSDRFIYANDDMFILKPSIETDFFDGYTPKIEMRCMTNVNGKEIWRITNINSFKLATGQTELNGFYMAPEHGFAAYTKKLVKEFNAKHYIELYNSCTQFREPKNLNIYFYAAYLWANNMLEDSPLKFKYIGNKCTASYIEQAFAEANVICINDTELEQDINCMNLIDELFAKKFGLSCIYELAYKNNEFTNSIMNKLPSNEVKYSKTVATKQNNNVFSLIQPNTYLYF